MRHQANRTLLRSLPGWLGAIVIWLTTLSGCGERDPATSRAAAWAAAPIRFGIDVCEACRMPIADRRFAAQAKRADGEPAAHFDDIGCLIIELNMRRLTATEIGVRHAREDRWIAASDATFIHFANTPMRFGYAAVDGGEPGRSFAEVCDEMAVR